jgi:hypothetical protein
MSLSLTYLLQINKWRSVLYSVLRLFNYDLFNDVYSSEGEWRVSNGIERDVGINGNGLFE